MNKYLIVFFFLLVLTNTFGQHYQTEKSTIEFFSSAPIEDIQALNEGAVARVDISNGAIAISIPINKFKFEKALMEEHFNEKYLESEKYPKATFTGKINEGIQVGKNGNVAAVGKLTIHGVTKNVTISGNIDWIGEKLEIQSDFTIRLDDFNVKIPKMMWQNIAEEVAVHVDLLLIEL